MSGSDEDLHILAEREKTFYAGLTASSAEIMDDVMSEDIVYVHSPGIPETKQENMTGQSSGLFLHGPIERIDGEIKVYGDLAVTSGVIDMVDLGHGPAITLRLQQTLVWIKEDGTWRLLSRHATKVAT